MDAPPPQEPSGNRPPPQVPAEVEAELRRRLLAGAAPPAPPVPVSAPPPPNAPPVAAAPAPRSLQERFKFLGPLAPLMVFLATKLKFLAVLAKFGLPVLKTGGTMLISIWFYAMTSGWPFAVGFVLLIFVHEMGHVFAAWRLKVPVSAPFFIPFMGALIIQKRHAKSVWDDALIGIGGPIGGTLGALACLGVYFATGQVLFLALAHVAFMLNLFNLAPFFPLDGGWITAAISPRLWLVGVLVLGGLFFTGRLHNPLLLILILFSLPRVFHGLRTGDVTPPGTTPVTPRQKWVMGAAYLALSGFLAWMMLVTNLPAPGAS